MSGGSWQYVYMRVEDTADRLVHETDGHPLRQALGHHLRKVAKALHDIEWVDSYDYGPGDELAAIRAVLGPFAGSGETEFAATLRALADELDGDCDRDVVLLSDAHVAEVQHSTLRALARRLRWRAEQDDEQPDQSPHVVRHEGGSTAMVHPVGRVEAVERPSPRCLKTGNPCGTDTRAPGQPCDCRACRVWLAASSMHDADALATVLELAECADALFERTTGPGTSASRPASLGRERCAAALDRVREMQAEEQADKEKDHE